MPPTGNKPPASARTIKRREPIAAPAGAESTDGQDASRRTHAERRDEAERRLLAAAVGIVSDRGVEGMTLAEVGEAAGYSRGLPAHYFGRKNDLVAAVASHIADGFANRLAQTSTQQPGMESLLHSVRAYFNGGLQTPASTRALLIALAEALTEPALSDAMSDVTRRSVRRLAAMLRHGIERGDIRRNIDPHAQAVMILGTLRTMIAQWTIDPDRIDLKAMRDRYVASLQQSLAA
ncbi:TetR/AcrR family transcriptional regulator [Reyranella sp. CPCC 100927]|uniref:TetR/AcrR family transcriptional regulator n=1 Tax=Reyranella sp. CPCC 100927 TaxID=2599616 RepID=UPI0011B45929|nr:TetR/AcrR family transcriptional regulator [Reyranella sp. CPCC 100927]TWT08781.1 TetR/AcrR family transcriptional regulator [Reyranella sp. CPCC 100927]